MARNGGPRSSDGLRSRASDRNSRVPSSGASSQTIHVGLEDSSGPLVHGRSRRKYRLGHGHVSPEAISSESDGEPKTPVGPRLSSLSPEAVRNKVNSLQDPTLFKQKSTLSANLANRMLPSKDTDWMIKQWERSADIGVQRTYIEGVPTRDINDDAVVLRVGLTFLPGADKPQVNRLEQDFMANKEPDQKDANWRVNTAGALLKNFAVSPDLSIQQTDNTAVVAKNARTRLRKSDSAFTHLPNDTKAPSIYNAVTIDSDAVKIVNDLRCGSWDLESTLIEVDGNSPLDLMFNYRTLIRQGGPDMSFEDTKRLLETMIEDARRLCVRSPILFRMSTRQRIISSKDIRYGVDHGDIFQTLTTSAGIREILSLSASYFNSLDPTGSSDTTQKFIRSRFLQMVVLLLLLLNDTDLSEMTDFLEATYKLKAKRQDLELLFLRVIPLMSINSKVFLGSLIPAFEGYPLIPNQDQDQKQNWETFIERILAQGYLLPGTVGELGHNRLSWIVKWPDDGFKSTTIFDNLQYNGISRTANDIPPIELHPEASHKELTVFMTNGKQYTVSSNDIERITCLIPGVYTVEATDKAEPFNTTKAFDLNISENSINAHVQDATQIVNNIIQRMNQYAVMLPKKKSRVLLTLGRKGNQPALLNDFKGLGRLTVNTAMLNEYKLAVAYKIEGRRIGRVDALRNMAKDIQELTELVAYIEQRSSDYERTLLMSPQRRELLAALEQVKVCLGLASSVRQQIQCAPDLCDEPIEKVFFPQGVSFKGPDIWFEYKAWFRQDNGGLLYVQAIRSSVTRVIWLSDDTVELSLHGRLVKYFCTPLGPVERGFEEDEAREGDIALLAGRLVIIAVVGEDSNRHAGIPAEALVMTNCLKITSVEEPTQSRRGANRTKKPDDKVISVFR